LRVTNDLLFQQALRGTQETLSRIEEQRQVISSGLRVDQPSDDPTATGGIMRSSSTLRATDQYRTNLNTASSRLSVEDGVLNEITHVLTRAKELAVSQVGSTASTSTRNVVKAEVDSLRDFVIELGNTKHADTYLFGGQYADSRPFSATGADPSRPPSGALEVEGGSGSYFTANHDGQELLVDSGILDALENLSLGLANDSETEIQAAMGEVDRAFEAAQEMVGELGARMNQVETALSNLDALEINLQTFRSDLQDADLEEAITELLNRQVSYQAAMMANARILNNTLSDYLR
jgi:flagellar hook-associated protein 3 FlgL